MTEPPHLTIVDENFANDHNQEFVPLPFYSWTERPSTLPLDHDEVATAIHLAQGDITQAAFLLKTPIVRVTRSLRASPRLQRVLAECHDIAIARAASEYIKGLDSPSDRRREWAAKALLATRAASSHPFAPAPPSSAQSASLALSSAQNGTKTLTFRWRTDADDVRPDDDIAG